MSHKVICINRRHGSGAAIAGRIAAEKLGINFYDEQLLMMAIRYGDLDKSKFEKVFESFDEKAPNKMFYKLYTEGNEHAEKESPASDIIYDLEKQILTSLAHKEDFIVMGRCAGTYLKDEEDVEAISIFATAPLDYRIRFITENSELDEKQAEEQIEKVDKQREKYYEYITKNKWEDPANYDVTLNIGNIGVYRAANALCGLYYNWDHSPEELEKIVDEIKKMYEE